MWRLRRGVPPGSPFPPIRVPKEIHVIRYIILGVVQGATEFLPISSSGHLVLGQRLLGIDPPGVLLEALLHWGTFFAILLVFRKDVAALFRGLTKRGSIEDRKEIGVLIAGTVPIVILGMLLRTSIGDIFGSMTAVGIGFLASAAFLFLGTVARRSVERNRAGFLQGLAVGVAQAAALIPGLSRSGATISVGRLCGLTPRGAARLSFLLALPALFGAGLISLWDAVQAGTGREDWLGLILGMLVAFLVGLLAIRALLALVSRGRLWIFGIYCGVLGILLLAGVLG